MEQEDRAYRNLERLLRSHRMNAAPRLVSPGTTSSTRINPSLCGALPQPLRYRKANHNLRLQLACQRFATLYHAVCSAEEMSDLQMDFESATRSFDHWTQPVEGETAFHSMLDGLLIQRLNYLIRTALGSSWPGETQLYWRLVDKGPIGRPDFHLVWRDQDGDHYEEVILAVIEVKTTGALNADIETNINAACETGSLERDEQGFRSPNLALDQNSKEILTQVSIMAISFCERLQLMRYCTGGDRGRDPQCVARPGYQSPTVWTIHLPQR